MTTLDLSKAGVIVAILSILGTGVTVVAKWTSVEKTVADLEGGYQKHDVELEIQHDTLMRLTHAAEHTHRDLYRLRQELRMSDRGIPLPRLGTEEEE